MSADEFDIIANHFAPLASAANARGLIDDVATIENLVVTTDAIVESVHFLADDPIDTIAKKALRVNLSDLAAKGAKPVGVLLTLIWPNSQPASQIADFARGLGEDLKTYDVPLLGGDTTSTPGPLTISITAFGKPLGARTPSRADAQAGDDIWVTGTIGDGVLGLKALRGEIAHDEHLVSRYRLPQPRVALAAMIAQHAHASMDVSDGLIGDAAKIAAASKAALRIDAQTVPLSAPARAWMEQGGEIATLLGGGDDYEILFTAPVSARGAIRDATRIGVVEEGAGVRLIGSAGETLTLPSGHRHALGSP